MDWDGLKPNVTYNSNDTYSNHKPIVDCSTGPWILVFVLPLKVSAISIGSYCNRGSKLGTSTVEKRQIHKTCVAYGTDMNLFSHQSSSLPSGKLT